MIAGLDDSLDREVQTVRAVHREDPSLRSLAPEELVEGVTRGVERLLGADGHTMPGSARIRQARSSEAVQGLVDRFGLREAGCGVVEVDHGS